jgi:glycosyltransferase involved in cell wall biosynthesis
MNSINPLVSVIVPCFNQGFYLHDTLESIFVQTYTNWECIIINDGSTDNTEEIAKKWCIKDKRFFYIPKENGGLSSARNAGINISKGEFILFLDSDDFISKSKIHSNLNIFVNDSDIDIVFNDFKFYDSFTKSYITPNFILKNIELKFQNILLDWDLNFFIPIHCSLIKTSILKNIFFNEELKAKEDWVFWCKIFIKNPKVYYLNSCESFYRKNGFGLSSNWRVMFENQILAYKFIFNWLPQPYILKFSDKCLDTLGMECLHFHSENMKIKRTYSFIFVRIERFLKRKLNI